MNVLLFTCPCDSIVATTCNNLSSCYPKVLEASTNGEDVTITAIICGTIAAITLILVFGFLVWKLIEFHAKKKDDERRRKIEEENRKNKIVTNLLDKKLSMLKDICKSDNNLEELNNKANTFKQIDTSIQIYLSALGIVIDK